MKKKLASRNSSTLPRTSCGKRTMKFVKLYKDPNCGFGMVITCGNTYDTVLHGAFVERVLPGSPAELDGNIAPGDQIMSVNGTDVQNDHFLSVVDLIQWSTNSLDIVIAKNQTSSLTNNFKKDIVERPFTKSKAWIVGNEKFKEAMPPIKAEVSDIHNGNEIPVPKPRKKWLEQEQTLNCVEPDLTLNHSSNANLDSRKKSSDSNNITRDNIPDIIASQMRQTLSSINSDLSLNTSEVNSESCELNTLVQEDADSNYLLPGEVFHVVLDKKGGSLGLNIYQGSESCSDQRYIYIHSVIPNGAADLDGRIKPGDKLLEVNSVPLDNLSYQEVVTKLRISPQVAHLVLEKGSLMEVDSLLPKEQNSVAANGFSNNNISNCDAESARKRKESSASAEACFEARDCNIEDQIAYSSLPVVSNTPKESAKDSVSSGYLKQNDSRNVCSNLDLSSPIHAKATPTTPYRFKSSLTSYSSTPNLAENSDEDDPNGSGGFLYRNRSSECLNTPHFMRPHQALLDFYQNYSYVRGSACSLHEIPAVPIRKKKLKKLDDIYNYCNSDNTFEVSVRKSSRGLGLSIFGGVDVTGRDHFSQLIRIRKLYPLQPALECGKLMLGDVILEVNGTKMVGLTNTEALEVLRCAPTDVVLKVFRPSKSLIPSFSTYKGGIWPFFDSSSSSASSSLSRGENNCYNVETGEFEVTLIKRGGSLGFSISCKESSSESRQDGIFVKALVREPAISDGRIHPGDKILQVNGTEMSSMSHAEAIEFIRNVPDAVTLKLLRNDPPATPGYKDEEYSISKPLRWEAVGFLNDRLKHKESSDEGSTPKRKLKRSKHNKAEMFSNASSNTSTESDTSSSSGQELILEEKPEDLSLEGVGLQRNQRPKSLDMLNSSDRKRCPTLDDDAFHRQSSVMCANNVDKVEDKSPEKKTTLLKWRGSTLPHTDEVDGPVGLKNEVLSSNGSEAADSVSDDEKPVPFPRTTSCASDWVHTFNVDLDRGWQSRLGFSLYDAPPDSPGSPRSHLLKAAEVKAVYPHSLAEKDGRIKVGDRLISVNNESLIDLPASVVIDILRKTRGLIRMVFCRLDKPT